MLNIMYGSRILTAESPSVKNRAVLHEVPIVVVYHPQAFFIVGFDGKEFWFHFLHKLIEFIQVVDGILAEFTCRFPDKKLKVHYCLLFGMLITCCLTV